MDNYQDKYNVNTAWTKLYDRLNNDGLLEEKRKFDFNKISRFAALFVLIAGISSVLIYYSNNHQVIVSTSKNEIRTIQLPDGSTVDLNAESELIYPEKFSGNKRIVELKGEAFFTVAKNKNKPFIIKAIQTEIKVLGTSFNVKTDTKNKQVKVFVKTGKVQFYPINNKQKSLVLNAGFVGTINQTSTKKDIIDDPNYLSWKTKYFDFSNGEYLGKIIEKLNEAYHVHIVLKNQNAANKIIYTTYNNYPLDKILQLISIAHNLEIEKTEQKIILK